MLIHWHAIIAKTFVLLGMVMPHLEKCDGNAINAKRLFQKIQAMVFHRRALSLDL